MSENGPYMNIDVPHIGIRGGSVRNRYYGQLEGICPELKQNFVNFAKAQGVDVATLLEDVIREKIDSDL